MQSATITDSARAKVLAHLTRGELAEALHAYEVATGLKAPLWLTGFKAASDASKQVPSACQGVARSIHAVFTRLGGKPEYVELTAQGADKRAYVEIVFRSGMARTHMSRKQGSTSWSA